MRFRIETKERTLAEVETTRINFNFVDFTSIRHYQTLFSVFARLIIMFYVTCQKHNPNEDDRLVLCSIMVILYNGVKLAVPPSDDDCFFYFQSS